MSRQYLFGRRPNRPDAADLAALYRAHLKRVRKQFHRLHMKERGGFKGSVQ